MMHHLRKYGMVAGSLLLISLLCLLVRGLQQDPREVTPVLIGQKAPAIQGVLVASRVPSAGLPVHRVWLLHVWATWCDTCRAEHAVWVAIHAHNPVPIVGLTYNDAPASVKQWLRQHQNPFQSVWSDQHGETSMSWGVYGVPETFLIDADGVVRARYVGTMTRERWYTVVWPDIVHWRDLTERSRIHSRMHDE